MSLTPPLSFAFYLPHALVFPPLLIGLIRGGKARLQGRRGPAPWQPFWDLAKLLRKSETISATTGWIFRLAPLLNLGALLAVSLMVPWLGVPSPLAGDLFLVVSLMVLGKFAMGLSALDSGSSFGALGASREAAIAVQSEPAMVLALAALATEAHSSAFAAMLTRPPVGSHLSFAVPLIVAALGLGSMAELARMPLDDPTTHLELTMIHEALILENSGRSLALIEYTVALKTAVLLGIIVQVLLMLWPPLAPFTAYLLSVGGILGCGAVLAVTESVLVKLRWRKVPNLLAFAVAAAALACLVITVKT